MNSNFGSPCGGSCAFSSIGDNRQQTTDNRQQTTDNRQQTFSSFCPQQYVNEFGCLVPVCSEALGAPKVAPEQMKKQNLHSLAIVWKQVPLSSFFSRFFQKIRNPSLGWLVRFGGMARVRPAEERTALPRNPGAAEALNSVKNSRISANLPI